MCAICRASICRRSVRVVQDNVRIKAKSLQMWRRQCAFNSPSSHLWCTAHFLGGMQINAVVSGGEVITIITACSTRDAAPTAVCNSHAVRRGCFSGRLGAGRIKVEEERIFVPPTSPTHLYLHCHRQASASRVTGLDRCREEYAGDVFNPSSDLCIAHCSPSYMQISARAMLPAEEK
ncbi:hypothetical protein B0H13DRAFT_1972729 [Mycena leptocephala]|nr:hypothetical protein B0H13DRAFT_1972729 [Mycena leptocephala]